MVLRLTVDTDCDTGTGNVLLGNVDADKQGIDYNIDTGNRILTLIFMLFIRECQWQRVTLIFTLIITHFV